MANTKQTIAVLRGKASFAKILGKPVPNYSKDGFEWKMDLVLTDAGAKELKPLGIADRVKRKDTYLEGTPHISFKQPELRKDGTKNDPIKVQDIIGKPWDQNKLIGNGSDVEVKFAVVDNGVGKKHGVYIRSVRILKLVPYERQEFDDVAEDDEFFAEFAAAQAKAEGDNTEFKQDFDITDDADLDDEVPV